MLRRYNSSPASLRICYTVNRRKSVSTIPIRACLPRSTAYYFAVRLGRGFLHIALFGRNKEASRYGSQSHASEAVTAMTFLESSCVKHCRTVAALHKKHVVPSTATNLNSICRFWNSPQGTSQNMSINCRHLFLPAESGAGHCCSK